MSALRFDIEWRLLVFTGLLFPLLLSLGFWQLQRAEEKVALEEEFAARRAEAPRPLGPMIDENDASSAAYARVEVSGYFHPDIMLFKDNQLRGGRYGVDVLGLFFDRAAGRWVLLNRGWVPADPARRSLPAVEIPATGQTLLASIYVSPGEPYQLGEEALQTARWPLLVQNPTDPAVLTMLRDVLDAPIYNHELRLAPGQPHGFRRDWPLTNSSPDRHRGYALQWFTMAGVLLLLFLLRSSNLADLIRPGRDRS